MDIIAKEVEAYIREITTNFDGSLGELQNYAIENGYPVIKKDAARFLSTILAVKRPKRVLEIGCCIGFSAGIMSRYLSEGGHITTIDRYDLMIKQAKSNFKSLGVEDKVTLLEGDALEIVPLLKGPFDFIFLDAAKGQYLQLLPHCMRLLDVSGIFIADDVFQKGYTALKREQVPRRQRTTHSRMREFLHKILHAEGLESSIIPIDDGMVLCTKTSIDYRLGE